MLKKKKKRAQPHQGERALRPGGTMPPPHSKFSEVPIHIVEDVSISRGCYDDLTEIEAMIPTCGFPSDPSDFLASWVQALYPSLPPPPEIREGPPPPPPKKPNGGRPGECVRGLHALSYFSSELTRGRPIS